MSGEMQSKHLFLVPHGEAGSEGVDADPPLTDRGIAEVTAIAKFAAEHLEVRPSRLLHCGRTRTRQTAEIWGESLRVPPRVGAGLGPDGDLVPLLERVCYTSSELMLIGHSLQLGRLVTMLLGTAKESGGLAFAPGALVGLDQTTGAGWEVALVLPPTAVK